MTKPPRSDTQALQMIERILGYEPGAAMKPTRERRLSDLVFRIARQQREPTERREEAIQQEIQDLELER